MKSIWTETTALPNKPALNGDLRTQAAVIGGGMAGLLIAYRLMEQGKKVVVLESDRIGSGQSGFTTAKLTSQHDFIYHRLISKFGLAKAQAYADINQLAIAEYKRLIYENSISCHFEEVPSYLYSAFVSEPLRTEAEAARKLGIKADFVSRTNLPFPVHGAVRFNNQGQFHPLEFMKAISDSLTIYEKTRVLSVKENQIFTDNGTVVAKDIIFACHFPFINLPGLYFSRMYQERSYVLALHNTQPLDGMYLGIDADGFSMRDTGDTLLLGGMGHRTGKKPKENPYDALRKAAKNFWPNSTESCCWSAQDCMTLDRIPYIGHFSKSTPHWYVATGFNKWGMTSSMVSAMIICDAVLGQDNPFAATFSPRRFHISASASEAMSHIMESSAGLTLGLLPGAARCPHLGCALTWNGTEQVWSCRCHGSRFDSNGKLLSGPAQEGVTFIE